MYICIIYSRINFIVPYPAPLKIISIEVGTYLFKVGSSSQVLSRAPYCFKLCSETRFEDIVFLSFSSKHNYKPNSNLWRIFTIPISFSNSSHWVHSVKTIRKLSHNIPNLLQFSCTLNQITKYSSAMTSKIEVSTYIRSAWRVHRIYLFT